MSVDIETSFESIASVVSNDLEIMKSQDDKNKALTNLFVKYPRIWKIKPSDCDFSHVKSMADIFQDIKNEGR